MNTIEQAYINGFIKAAAPIKSFEELAELLSKAKAPEAAAAVPPVLPSSWPAGVPQGPPTMMPRTWASQMPLPTDGQPNILQAAAPGIKPGIKDYAKGAWDATKQYPGRVAATTGAVLGAGPAASWLGSHSVHPDSIIAKAPTPKAPGMGAELMKALANHKYLAMGGAGLAAGGGLAALLANHHKKEEQQPTEAPLANEPQPL